MPKTIISARNPLTSAERAIYYNELAKLQRLRENIKLFLPKQFYNRCYTEPMAGGKCRIKLYGMAKEDMERCFCIGRFYADEKMVILKHVEERWHGKVYSIVLRIK